MNTPDLNIEMQQAWQYVAETGVSLFLTGKAGTGKTTFLRRLKNAAPKRMVVLAPTGVAALNAEGQTIHSFFQLALSPYIPGYNAERETYFRMSNEKKKIIRTLDLLVIDEISMVRCDVLDAVDAELRKYRDHTKPFGGVQLLMIGDLQQLSPVAKDEEWALLSRHYDTPYFFSSKALQQINYATIELQTVYRQQDKQFVELLGKIRENRIDAEVLQKLNSRYVQGFLPPEGQQWIRLTTHNYMAQQYNAQCLDALNEMPFVFQADIKGNFPEYLYPTDVNLQLKKGAQVMFVKNDISGNHLFYNGKIGKIVDINEQKVVVMCPGDEKPIEVIPMRWDNSKYVIDDTTKEIKEIIDGSFSQLPLRTAWAITVHKSQGLTFDHVILDINESFAHGQVYVALSRCRTLEGMVLSQPMDGRSVITDTLVSSYVSTQHQLSADNANILESQRFMYYATLLEELFTFRMLFSDLDRYVRMFDRHLGSQYTDYLRLLFDLRTRMDAEVCQVADKFRVQYHAILNTLQGKDFANDEQLKSRVLSASLYFSGKLREIFSEIIDTVLNIENKQVLKQYNNAYTALKESYDSKLAALDYCVLHGFSVKEYLRTKALGLLMSEPAKKKRVRQRTRNTGDVEPKAPRVDTKRLSFEMFNAGKDVAAIAAERNLKPQTIESHLAHFVGTGELDIRALVPSKHEQMIRNVMAKFTTSYSLSDIKAELPGFITYLEIKCVMAQP